MLGEALRDERESVRRAATYGLAAVGDAATDTLLESIGYPVKWVRKAAVYGLGDASPLTEEVLTAVAERLAEDPSVYVRAVAAGSLGCLGRRALATETGVDLVPRCFAALVACLGREQNRLAMDIAQNRSIKFTRPTDESDVCEGGGADYNLDGFEPVRSAVRESALWSLVILSSHGAAVAAEALQPTVTCLKEVLRSDRNIFDVGFAMDALCRLVQLGPRGVALTVGELPQEARALRQELVDLLRERPARPWEALVPAGLPAAFSR